ncbi:MAG: AMP-binding protein [Chloroflexi bacterium]|nr:AMP-binding protein [Chloroflexota bacterium]
MSHPLLTSVASLQITPQHDNKTALVFIEGDHETRYTFGELRAQVRRCGHALRAAGIQRGQLVVLVIPHRLELVYHFWGALHIGAVPSIFPFLSDKLNPERYFDSVRRLVQHSGVRAVITTRDFEGALQTTLTGIDVLLLTLEQFAGANAAPENGDTPLADAHDLAFLQHSSGSTGLQKGVMLAHGAVLRQLTSYAQAIQLDNDDVIVSWLPLYHDMGLIAGFILPLLAGVKLVLMSPFQWVRDPKILLRAIQRHRGTLCWLPNFAYNFLATRIRDKDLDGLDLSSMRAFINCSEPVYAESHRLFAERYAAYGLRADALQTCYAMAENVFAVTQSAFGTAPKIDIVDRRALMDEQRALPASGAAPALTLVSNGAPIAGCRVRIVDMQRQDLPERHVGEIAIHSASLMDGYYRRPEESAAVMSDGWYFTGDMGYLAAGELYITGRKKDLIIVGGKNIYPQDIENLLNDISGLHPGRASAFGVPNAQLGTEDIAIVAEVDASALDDDDRRAAIQREIRARVAQNTDMIARYVHLVSAKWLIKTSSGKIARSANRDKFLQEVLNADETPNASLL